MKSLIDYIKEAEEKKVAIGHFNISDLAGLKAIFAASQEASLALSGREAAKNLQLPIIIGVSEGEREFIGARQAAALVKSLREEFNYPIFLNADHTHSLEKIKEAVEAGFDAVIFDGSKLIFGENVRKTKEAIDYVKDVNPNILVEGEVGYIGSGSTLLRKIPEGAVFQIEDLTRPDEAERFVIETGVDLFSPAVGNIHGMLANAPNPKLNIGRIKEIKEAVKIPLVLHGGSGITDEDFRAAIDAGISIIHINTEIRLAWRKGLEQGLKSNPEEITPYKLLQAPIQSVKEVVKARLALFNKML